MSVIIKDVAEGSYAEKSGIKPQDILLTINGNEIADVLDAYMRFLPYLACHALLQCLASLHKASYKTIIIASEISAMHHQDFIATLHTNNNSCC